MTIEVVSENIMRVRRAVTQTAPSKSYRICAKPTVGSSRRRGETGERVEERAVATGRRPFSYFLGFLRVRHQVLYVYSIASHHCCY